MKIKIHQKQTSEKTSRPHPVEYYSWVEGGKYLPISEDDHADIPMYTLPNITEFPNYIFDQYGKYQLTEANVWNCDQEEKKAKQEMFLYQKFVRDYLKYESPYRGLLLYYGLGSGKTRAAVEVAKEYRKLGHQIVFISPAALVDNYLEELGKWGAVSKADVDRILGLETRKSKLEALERIGYRLVSYNAPNKLAQLKKILEEDQSGVPSGQIKDKVIIIDEVHNMCQFIHNGMNQPQAARRKSAEEFYRLLLYATNCRFILLSGTPMINVPSEMSILFNILRGPMRFRARPENIKIPKELKQILPTGVRNSGVLGSAAHEVFPTNREIFDELFVNWKELEIKPGMAKLFKQRIMGLVSYYSGAKGDVYPDIVDSEGKVIPPSQHPWNLVEVEMNDHQYLEYKAVRAEEEEQERKNKGKKSVEAIEEEIMDALKQAEQTGSTFRIKSRQVSNFSLPDKLKKFRPQSISAEPGKLEQLYGEFNKLNEAFDEIEDEDQVFLAYNLEKYSAKMYQMFNEIESDRYDNPERDGNILVYSNFRSIEGIEIFARVLEANGYTWYNPEDPEDQIPREIEEGGDMPRFAILGSDYRTKGQDHTTEILRVFNSPENTRGNIIKVLLGTANIAEGLSLFNIRKVLIMEPHWNMVRINQLIGRARRICSHRNLPRELWNFQVFIYVSVIPENKKISETEQSTDQVLYEIALRKEIVKNLFIHLIKEASVDCLLNATHNENKKQTPAVQCLGFGDTEDETIYTYFPDIQHDLGYDPKGKTKTKTGPKQTQKPANQKSKTKISIQPKPVEKVVEVKGTKYTPPKIILDHPKLKAKYIDPETNLERFAIVVHPDSLKEQKVVVTFKDDNNKPKKEWTGIALYDRSSLEHSGELIFKGYLLQGKPAWPLTKKSQVSVVKEFY